MVGWRYDAGYTSILPERPTNLDNSVGRAYCASNRCGRGLFGHCVAVGEGGVEGLFGHFFSHLSLLFSFSLSQEDGQI